MPGYFVGVAPDREIKKLKKDLARTREEIAALQKRIQAFITKRREEADDFKTQRKKSSD